jgi:hypothetical protein
MDVSSNDPQENHNQDGTNNRSFPVNGTRRLANFRAGQMGKPRTVFHQQAMENVRSVAEVHPPRDQARPLAVSATLIALGVNRDRATGGAFGLVSRLNS